MANHRRIPYAVLPGGAMIGPDEAASDEIWFKDYGCPQCGDRLRLHRQRKPSGPRPHFEHVAGHKPCPLVNRLAASSSAP